MTKVFRYKILRDNRLVLTNWINADNREDALQKLAGVKKEMGADTIHLTEVSSPKNWRCEND